MKQIFILLMVAMCATIFTACSKDDDTDPFDVGGDGVITMTTEGEEINFVIGTEADEIITIDWGDGQTKEYKGNRHDDGRAVWYATDARHTYSQAGTYTIKLTGLVTWLEAGEQLTSLNARGCTALESLACYKCQLTSLDVRGCTSLTRLECFINQLTSLDVRGCTALTELDCGNNKLTTLDVSENITLTELDCGNNKLTTLDVSENITLTELDCHGNQLTSKALNKIFTDLPKGKTWTDEYGDINQCRISVSDNPGSDTCNKSIAENKGWIVVN